MSDRCNHAREGNVNVDAIPYLAGGSAVAALALAAYFFNVVKAADPGNDRMQYLMKEIQDGSRAFLKKEYTWVAGFVVWHAKEERQKELPFFVWCFDDEGPKEGPKAEGEEGPKEGRKEAQKQE